MRVSVATQQVECSRPPPPPLYHSFPTRKHVPRKYQSMRACMLVRVEGRAPGGWGGGDSGLMLSLTVCVRWGPMLNSRAVALVQGIVNRAAPQLLVNYTQSDPYWLQYTMSRGFLSGQTLVPIPDLGSLVRQFASAVTGVVRHPSILSQCPRRTTCATTEGVTHLEVCLSMPCRAALYCVAWDGCTWDRVVLCGALRNRPSLPDPSSCWVW